MSTVHWTPGLRRAFPPVQLPRLALLTLAACLVSLAWTSHASAVIFAAKPFSDNRPGTTMRDVVVRGSDNHVWLNTFNGTNWNGWLDLGGDVRGRPTSISLGANHLDIYARDSANHLMHRYWLGSNWSNWEPVGGGWQFVGDPIPVSWGSGRVDIFARGTDNTLNHVYFNGAWSSWESLGGSLGYDPAVISHHSGHLDIFAVTPGGLLNHRYFDAANWGWAPWQGLGGFQFTSAPSAATTPAEIMVVARGTNGAPGGNFWNPTAGWIGNFTLGGNTNGQPAVVSYGDPIYGVFIRGTDNYLYHRWTDATQWSNWVNVGGPWLMSSDPNAIAWGGNKEDVFAVGTDGSVIHTWFNGSSWQPWENLGAPYPTSNQYGGPNYTVDTQTEKQAAITAFNALTSNGARESFWNGLAPADAAGLGSLILASGEAGNDPGTLPSFPGDWNTFYDSSVTAVAAAATPTHSGCVYNGSVAQRYKLVLKGWMVDCNRGHLYIDMWLERDAPGISPRRIPGSYEKNDCPNTTSCSLPTTDWNQPPSAGKWYGVVKGFNATTGNVSKTRRFLACVPIDGTPTFGVC